MSWLLGNYLAQIYCMSSSSLVLVPPVAVLFPRPPSTSSSSSSLISFVRGTTKRPRIRIGGGGGGRGADLSAVAHVQRGEGDAGRVVARPVEVAATHARLERGKEPHIHFLIAYSAVRRKRLLCKKISFFRLISGWARTLGWATAVNCGILRVCFGSTQTVAVSATLSQLLMEYSLRKICGAVLLGVVFILRKKCFKRVSVLLSLSLSHGLQPQFCAPILNLGQTYFKQQHPLFTLC